MVICLERGADLHMAQLMPLPLTVSCFSKIQIVFTFLVPAHPGSPGKRAIKRRVCVCVLALENLYKWCESLLPGVMGWVSSVQLGGFCLVDVTEIGDVLHYHHRRTAS